MQGSVDIDSLKKYALQLGLAAEPFSSCVDTGKYLEDIQLDMADGKKYQVSGTPTFFVNGNRVVGVEQLQQTVELVASQGK